MQLDDEIARASRARKGTPFLSTEQAAFYLGLSADICGFTAAGDVQFAFDPLPPST